MINNSNAHKSGPTIRKDVSRARLRARAFRIANAAVVGVSLAGTLIGWALFSRQDALVAGRASEAAIAPLAAAGVGESVGALASASASAAAGFTTPAGYALKVGAASQASTTTTAMVALSAR